jgi:hypothetical protein
MDVNGARALTERIAAQQHWLQAQAVRDGSQPAADPDIEDLEAIGDGYRLYRDGLRKTLVDQRWEAVHP